jgi:FtsP/CotA-like multicopper oxidase with cupredoxin domain
MSTISAALPEAGARSTAGGEAPVSPDVGGGEARAETALAGADASQRVRLPAGTYWYHPHKHGSVAYQVSNGLVGMMVVRGDVDRIPEITDLTEQVLVIQGIQYGLTSSSGGTACMGTGEGFSDAGYVDPRAPVGSAPSSCPATSQVLTVNGQVRPTMQVQAGEIQRWRVLNGTYDSFFFLTVETSQDDTGEVLEVLSVIGVDGVPLTNRPGVIQVPFAIGADRVLPTPYVLADGAAAPVTQLTRQEVLTDEISVLAPGQRYTALAAIPATQGPGPLYVKARFYPYAHTSKPTPPTQVLMTLEVTGAKATPDPMPPPERFSETGLFRPPLDRTQPPRPVNIVFDFCAWTQGGGSVTIGDGVTWFNGCGPQLYLKLGQRTVWTASGRGGAHAFHIHINSFMLTRRFGMDIGEASIWRDTLRLDQQKIDSSTQVPVVLPPAPVPPPSPPVATPQCFAPGGSDSLAALYEAEFESQQEDFTGDFVMHCHALHHEDMGMMIWVNITDGELPQPDNAGKRDG